MRVFLILLLVVIAINFSLAANTDSSKAKKAQNEAKAIITKLKSKANGQKNKLKGKLVAAGNKHVSQMKKTGNTVSGALKPLGNQGQAFAVSFKGNVTQMVETFNLVLNSKSLDAILKVTSEQLRIDFIDPIQADITNLTKAINKKSSAYDCFKSSLKSLQTIADNVIIKITPMVEMAGATAKSNLSSIDAKIESLRKTAVTTLKACKGSEACGVKYYGENNETILGNLTMFNLDATIVLTSAIEMVYSEAVVLLTEATELYRNVTVVISKCING